MFVLKEFREALGVTQKLMAEAMGMPLRSYQDIEGSVNPVRPVHEAAANWAAVILVNHLAVDPRNVPRNVREQVNSFSLVYAQKVGET